MNRHLRFAFVTISSGAALALGAGPASASMVAGSAGLVASPPPAVAAAVPPEPVGEAQATALHVGLLGLCLSCTDASAGAHSSRAHATAIRLLGHEFAGGGTDGNGSARGQLLGVHQVPLLGVGAGDWDANSGTGAIGGGHSRAALLDADVVPGQDGSGLVGLAVLETQSDARWDGGAAHGHASSDAADLDLIHLLHVRLLHSEADDGGRGRADPVDVNDIAPLSTGDGPDIEVPGVVAIDLLDADCRCGRGGRAVIARVGNLLCLCADEVVLGMSSASGGAALGDPDAPSRNQGRKAAAGAGAAVDPTGAAAAAAAAAPPPAPAVAAHTPVPQPRTGSPIGRSGLLLVGLGLALLTAAVWRRVESR